jgi:hypothetical protein
VALVDGWGIAPSEFWRMTLSEVLALYQAKRPRMKNGYAGTLTQGDVDDLAEWMRSWDEPAPA